MMLIMSSIDSTDETEKYELQRILWGWQNNGFCDGVCVCVCVCVCVIIALNLPLTSMIIYCDRLTGRLLCQLLVA